MGCESHKYIATIDRYRPARCYPYLTVLKRANQLLNSVLLQNQICAAEHQNFLLGFRQKQINRRGLAFSPGLQQNPDAQVIRRPMPDNSFRAIATATGNNNDLGYGD